MFRAAVGVSVFLAGKFFRPTNGLFLPTNGFSLPGIHFGCAVVYSLRQQLIAEKFPISERLTEVCRLSLKAGIRASLQKPARSKGAKSAKTHWSIGRVSAAVEKFIKTSRTI
jgi:hypothetical protein